VATATAAAAGAATVAARPCLLPVCMYTCLAAIYPLAMHQPSTSPLRPFLHK
jgi:hypothetical protein